MAPRLLALFFATGASGLIYQTVWMRMLTRVFGVTVWATTTVVAVFMAGLAIGALYAARTADARPSLARWGKVELGVALSASVATVVIAALPGVWGSFAADAAPPVLVAARVIAAALCLALPTFLMGMTLPLLVAAWRIERALPLLYGVNTMGAVLGSLAVGFVLLALCGESGSIAVAAALNVAAGVVALRSKPMDVASTSAPAPPAAPLGSGHAPSPEPARETRRVGLWAAATVGFVMLGLEIAWTRQLVFIVGSSTYAFTSMIAMYLTGIGIGGLLASRRPVVSAGALGAALFSLGALVLLSLNIFGLLALSRLDPVYTYSPLTSAIDVLGFLGSCALVVVPPTLVSGLVFAWLVTWTAGSSGKSTGTVYAWNTFGGVGGALVTGFGLLPLLGPTGTAYLLAFVLLVVAVSVTAAARALREPGALVAAGIAAAAFLTAPTDDVTGSVVAKRYEGLGYRVVRHVDGVDAAVTVLHPLPDAPLSPILAINGVNTSAVSEASQLLGHLPLAMQDAPHSALVICFGVGGTFSSAAQHVDEVHTVELIDEVVRSYPLFGGDPALLSARNNRVFIDDGRNFLLRSRRRYDAVIVDGAPPLYGAGAINLYSSQMMALVSSHLTDTGVFLLWLPTQTWRDDVWSIIRGVTDAFEQVAIIAPTGTGILVLAGHGPLDLSLAHIAERAAARPRVDARFTAWMLAALQPSAELRILTDAEVRARAAGFPRLSDDRPRTEFPLGHLIAGAPLVTRGVDFVTE